ncbi:phage tail spike protein [Jeotgalibacillus proteolyticus]
MQLQSILQNAYAIGYETPLNELWSASFSMPLNDPKNQYCKPFNYVEVWDGDERIELFRIMPTLTTKNENENSVSYQCEHVLATLIDDLIDDYAQWTNFTTRVVLTDMLQYQEVKRWALGRVAFTRYFHYGIEKEELYSVIMSIPRPFDQQYQWNFDTTVFPWVLHLDAASNEIVGEARWGKNIQGITKESDPYPVATRIYPYGYGEGVNQLNIEEVNPTGKRYIEAEPSIIEQYGIIKYVWVDRRFEVAASLYSSGLAKLNELKTPKNLYTVNVVDLKKLGDLNRFDVGKLVRITDEDLGIVDVRVRKFKKSDIYGAPHAIELEIGDKLDDTGTTQADLERRQQINDTYSQGATNIDSHSYVDNCDPGHPAVIEIFLDEGLVNVNTMNLTFKTEGFRSYSRATEGGGARVDTTSSGGGTSTSTESGGESTQTSSSGGANTATSSSGGGTTASSTSGGGTSKSTDSGGGSAQTSGGGGDHRHVMFQTTGSSGGSSQSTAATTAGGLTIHLDGNTPTMTNFETLSASGNHSHSVTIPSHSHDFSTPNHSHDVTIPNHTHSVNIPNHTHNVTIPAHTHNFTIPNHTHSITLPDHVHEIEHGIYRLNTMPSSVQIKVDGNIVPINDLNVTDLNIIPYLAKDSGGRVTRGTWHTIEITPNNLARINANVISRLFIQSRSGGKF